MDSTSPPDFKRKSSHSSSPAEVGETARSPPDCSPFLSPSPPSSEPSSPFSSSSSVCGSTLVYKNNVKSQSEVARVSSTSTQPFATSMSNNASLEQSLGTAMQGVSFTTEDDEKTGMYDPYSITDKEKGRKLIVVEGHGEKYDPFDPTGSPQSDMDDGFDGEEILEENVKKDEEPPDSTEILMAQPSPSLTSQKHLRRRIESSSFKARRLREGIDSEHSEIEEGEIVGAGDRDGAKKKSSEEALILNSPSISFFGSKPERILRVLDGDGFVSVCTEESWEDDRELEDELAVGAEDLRRKLVSRRKERYLSFPASSPLSSQAPLTPFLPQASKSASPVKPSVEQTSKNHKSSKGSKDSDRQKSKEKKLGEKVVKRKKRRKGKEEGGEKSKEKEREKKDGKEVRTRGSSRSSSRKGKKRRHVSPEVSHHTSSKEAHSRRSFSSLSEERYRERDKDKDRTSYRERGRDTDRDRHLNRSSSHRNDENGRSLSSRRSEGEKKGKRHSSSRERGLPKRSNNSKDERESDGDRQHKKERRRDGRPVVPPSIQDLNGSDLFAIKRTITVTTTTTTTTVPGSPRLSAASPCRPVEDRKRIKWPSTNDTKDRERVRSRSLSLSPPRYHTYESDRYSDKLEIDMLSLDGEALDSDYPSLEDTPPAALPLEPPVPKPKAKPSPKTRQSHPKKKSHTIKKSDSSSNRTTNKCLSSLTVTSGPTSIAPCVTSAKRVRKVGKDKVRDKSNRKDLNRSCKSKKESGGSRKGKLQSKVSVLVREGVSSTTGASVGSGKLSMDLLGPGGTGGGAGGSVVGGSIAVVFCRDNESRSPFLKPCSEPLSLGGRSKDLAGIGKRSSLAGPPSSLTSPAGLKSKKPKPSSITSTSSSASSPTSSLATKRRRRLAKKNSKKGATSTLPPGNSSQAKSALEGWVGASFDAPSAVGDGSKSVSPHVAQAGPPPCSSSSSSSTSSSTSVLPPSSSPPHTPPPSNVPLRDTRESSPDSQTVDSSCKTPEPAFPPEDCPVQKSPSTPASSPSSLSTSQGAGLGSTLSTQTVKPPPPEDLPKTLASPPCSSSSAGLASLSLSLSSADPSSSSSVSSSSASKMPAPPPAAATLPWSLQTGVDCTTGGVLALTALLFKMEEANIASRAKAQEFIQATSQILSQANQNQSQHHVPPSSTSSSAQVPPPPTVPPPPGLSPDQFILHSSLPLVVCTKTPPPHLHASLGGGCAQTPPPMLPVGLSGAASGSGEAGWENENKDSDKYLKKLHTQERAVEEVKLAIKPYYQRKDINKNEYKDILRKAVHKICHSRTGEINPVKVSNLVKLYVQRYKYFRKHGRKMDEEEREDREQGTLYSSA